MTWRPSPLAVRFAAYAALPVLLAILALGVALFPDARRSARFEAGDCRRIPLVDATTGAWIVGVEDLARDGGTLVLSAHDRRAARLGLGAGGLYRVGLAALAGSGPLTLEPLPGSPAHPHGLDVDPGTGRIAVVARDKGPRGHLGAAVEVLDRRGRLARFVGPGLCAGNDVTFVDGAIWVSIDRGRCPGTSLRDVVWPEGRGRLMRLDPATGEREVNDRPLTHPNGLLPRIGGGLWVAETRADRLSAVGAPGTALPAPIGLPGGPDNLTRGPEGAIVAAVHPNLLHLGLYLEGWAGRAPSRVVAAHPAGRVEVLYDDPSGSLWPAATVAVLGETWLVAGSAAAPGLLVCGAPA